MSELILWGVAEIDRYLFRDDPEEAETLIPAIVYKTPEAAIAAVNKEWAEIDDEAIDENDKVGPLKWAMVDDYWVAELERNAGPGGTTVVERFIRVYPVRVME